MKEKQLIIMVFYVDVEGQSRQTAEEHITRLMENTNLSKDEEIKQNFIIRQMWIPVMGSGTKVEVLYPVPFQNSSDSIIMEFLETMEKSINDAWGRDFQDVVLYWKKLYRDIKLKKLKENE